MEPEINVGIVSGSELRLVLHHVYHCASTGIHAEGPQTFSLTPGGKIAWLGIEHDVVDLQPTARDCTFDVADVTIGVNFHWERRETQKFTGAAKIIVDYEFYPGRCHHVVDAVARQRRFGRNVCGPALQYCQYGGNHLGRVFHHYAHGFLARRYFGEYCLGHLVELRICDRAVVANHGSDPGLGNGEIMKM